MSEQAAYTAWCRSHFAMMSEGGIWAVPRSGLMFAKRGGELVLYARMPWTPELAEAVVLGLDVPADEAGLRAYQDADYETIREQFELAGIVVRRELAAGE